MNESEKVLRSAAMIRFQDCDPYQHLNNANYLHYFINAREDQVRQHYGIDIYKMAKEDGVSWMVTQNQIAYFRPAMLVENVIIETQLIRFTEKTVTVEMRMWNESQTELKSVLWSVFIYVSLKSKSAINHSEELMNLFKSVWNPVEDAIFENRVAAISKG